MGVADCWDESSEAWVQWVDQGDPHRELLLDPIMLSLCDDVEGLQVLDVGCGEGRFARMLAARGAFVHCVDSSSELIEEAKRRGGGPTYQCASAERLPFSDGSFDLAIAYLVLIDVKNYARAIEEMARVLKPGGRLVQANINGFVTASPNGWHKDAAGHKLHFPVDEYLDERGDYLSWSGIDVINWHRPLSAYMRAFLKAGLTLRYFDEPAPKEQAVAKDQRLAPQLRVPYFNVMVWERPLERL